MHSPTVFVNINDVYMYIILCTPFLLQEAVSENNEFQQLILEVLQQVSR